MLEISKNTRIDDTAYQAKVSTLQVLRAPVAGKIVAHWLLGIFALCLITLFLPWQQNIRARGAITAFTPADRPQTVETAIPGRIKEWKVREGQIVKEGDTILILSEIKDKFFDPELLMRLQEQLDAKSGSIGAKESKILALTEQIRSLEDLLTLKVEQAENKIMQTRLKVESDSMDWEAAKVDARIYERQLQGTQTMYDSGLVALVKWESARSKKQQADAKQLSAMNKYNASKTELNISKLALSTVRAEILGKLAKARSDRAATASDLYESRAGFSKSRNEYANMEIRNQQYVMRAPQDGYVVKALKSGIGETIKEGEAVVTVMPLEPEIAVELFVKAMDVPLLDTGRHVRLQFEGWPALQFSGWPSVAVGTFGGKLKVIDYIDSQEGKYRVLIIPDTNTAMDDEEWPAELRQGSGVFGWVMLDEVPVWFEIWRQLNGFPPTIKDRPEDKGKGETATGKK
ncbi:MAG: HlyD family secretion protein [Flammeovirgaceae bacterium]